MTRAADPQRQRVGRASGPAGPIGSVLSAGWLLALVGGTSAVVAAAIDPGKAAAAAGQDWPPFVLVAGLLLIGLVAEQDGLFSFAGHRLAGVARNGGVLFAGAVLLISVVTAVLNLDTSVAFLTPMLIYTARSRGEGEAPLLYGCVLLSNAASLLLPGSNLTNLIVVGHRHLSGGRFAARMAPAWVAAIIVTGAVVAVAERRSLRTTVETRNEPDRPVLGLGLVAVAAAVALVVLLASPRCPWPPSERSPSRSVWPAGAKIWPGSARCSARPCWSAC